MRLALALTLVTFLGGCSGKVMLRSCTSCSGKAWEACPTFDRYCYADVMLGESCDLRCHSAPRPPGYSDAKARQLAADHRKELDKR